MKYASRNWKAVETTNLVGSEHMLTVTGEVQVLKSNDYPKLIVANPQGIVAQTLILDLTVERPSNPGGNVVFWKPASYEQNISSHQYMKVTIRGDTEEQTVTVQQVLS
jgi:hypothetical protein